jgi:large subunit ribosomal protein L15
VKKGELVKILGEGEISSPLVISAHAFSKSAREKIEKAGGKVIILP